MKYSKKILFSILYSVIFVFTFGLTSVQGKEIQKAETNYTVLLKDPSKMNVFLENIDTKDKNIIIIKEIGLIYIKDNELNKDLEKKLLPHKEEVEKYISLEGELPILKAPTNKSSISNVSTILESPSNIEMPPLTSTYFKPFNGYLEELTNNYQSYQINKGENTSIALIDSGIDINHPILKNNINLKKGKNYTSDKLDYNDEMGHGTSVAGVLVSIAPNTTITPYKVMGEESGESIWVIKAIIDATNDGNDILNLSLGTYKSKNNKEDKILIKAYERAVKYANKHESLVIAAAGNASKNLDESKKNGEIYLPGGLKNVISVSSSNNIGELSSYSNYGKNIDFSANGGDLDENYDVTGLILTTFPTNKQNNLVDQIIGIPAGYTLSYGTSLSAPQVSATSALIISEYNRHHAKKIKLNKVVNYLKKGSIDLGDRGYDAHFGYGNINAYQSLMELR